MQMDLFAETSDHPSVLSPLADRMRAQKLDDFVGQKHLVAPGRILQKMIETQELVSLIFWGPPGVGKTTLARILAKELNIKCVGLSAVTAGVKDVRQVMEQATLLRRTGKRTLLFIDEIHRFNKSQQDALLHGVEDGTIILIGATTENPSFEVNRPLLSRCRVLKLEPLSDDDIDILLKRALTSDVHMQKLGLVFPDDVYQILVEMAGGDGRVALSTLELCGQLAPEEEGKRIVRYDVLKEAMQKRALGYDKKGDFHYDVISAFIKSVRGSDPDGAVYWLARMLDAGEDPLFIARRMLILASEDVGNAEPAGLMLANAAYQAVHAVGMPEARIILSQAATYLASAPKSNAAYLAIDAALADVQNNKLEPVPLHLRNAPTTLMKKMGYSEGYQYAHDFPGGFVEQKYLPEGKESFLFYKPKAIGKEKAIKERLEIWWKKRTKDKA